MLADAEGPLRLTMTYHWRGPGELRIKLPRNLQPGLPRLCQRLHRLCEGVDPGELLLRLRSEPAITLHGQVNLAVAHPGAHDRHWDPALSCAVAAPRAPALADCAPDDDDIPF